MNLKEECVKRALGGVCEPVLLGSRQVVIEESVSNRGGSHRVDVLTLMN